MSKTFKQKVRHILFDENGNLNIHIPLKLKWSYINKIWRHNYDRDLDRAILSNRRDKISKADMKHQIKEL